MSLISEEIDLAEKGLAKSISTGIKVNEESTDWHFINTSKHSPLKNSGHN